MADTVVKISPRQVIDVYRACLERSYAAPRTNSYLLYFPNVGLLKEHDCWFNWCRRLSKDYEILPQTSEAFIYVAMIRLMLKQLA